MEQLLKIYMGDKYYKHTKLYQNLRGNLTISYWFDMEWPLYIQQS